ncbi:hypothetical protein AB0420_04085 [Streptomyces caelestis]|uniref:hypothetical protein n=1 Tax=Streptomyces caelestis TaxID=36816 RepID=UPI00344C7B4C
MEPLQRRGSVISDDHMNATPHGWVFVRMTDGHDEAEAVVPYLNGTPERFLHAVARPVLGDEATRAESEGEPLVYRMGLP